jgi:hypothetical protein
VFYGILARGLFRLFFIFKKEGFAWEWRHPGARTIVFYMTWRPSGDLNRGGEISTSIKKTVFHIVFMGLGAKVVIS